MDILEEQEAYLSVIGTAENLLDGLVSRADEDGCPDVATAADDILGKLDALRTILRDYWEEAEAPEPYYSLAEPPR